VSRVSIFCNEKSGITRLRASQITRLARIMEVNNNSHKKTMSLHITPSFIGRKNVTESGGTPIVYFCEQTMLLCHDSCPKNLKLEALTLLRVSLQQGFQ